MPVAAMMMMLGNIWETGLPIASAAGVLTADVVVLQLLAIGLLVFLNGFFVACEFAIVKVRSSQLDELVARGVRSAPAARDIVANMDAYLSAAQLGITLTSLGLGWAGEPFLARMLAPVFAAAGLESGALTAALSFSLAFAAITYLHIVAGEQAPKVLAIRRALAVLLVVSWPLKMFYVVFRPAIYVINASSNWLLKKVLRVGGASEHDTAHTTEELRLILKETESGEAVSSLGREILINALDLRERVVRDIMTPRGEVVFLDLEHSFEANVQAALASQHTRFPLCKGHLDDAIGLVHIKDLLGLTQEHRSDLQAISRELVHVPEMMPLEKLLKFFLTRHAHLAVVVDEYGGATGVVTLDNVLEELVGDIQDEFDTAEAEYRKLAEGEYILEGTLGLYELKDLLGVKLESAEVSTVGGYVTHRLGHLPRVGEKIEADGYVITVTQTDGRRVVSLHAKRLPVRAG